MKLLVIGLGQCGGRLADEFAKINSRARSQRGMEIIVDTFAVNSDEADLSGLQTIRRDYRHRILIGSRRTGGHGVGKLNEVGAELAREDGDKVIESIRTARRFFESDAFLLLGSAAGGTGSGSLPVMAHYIKERYRDKPVYALVVLPFQHEEQTEGRTVYNAATCLKSIYPIANAVFLVDNQRYIKKDSSLRNNLAKINSLIVAPFYDLLCAGEEKKSKYVGAKTLDAGDIMQTLTGWTAIGYGRTALPVFKNPFTSKETFTAKSTETHKGIQAMDEALTELSINCNTADAARALYLLSAPGKEMNMALVKEIGEYLKSLAPTSIIRYGDYPREKGLISVTVVLSELADVAKIREYYGRALDFMSGAQEQRKEVASKLGTIEEAAKDVPSLLG